MESVAILRHLLARAESGEVHGLAICAKVGQSEEILFVGDYRDNHTQALNASLRMSWQLTKLEDAAGAE